MDVFCGVLGESVSVAVQSVSFLFFFPFLFLLLFPSERGSCGARGVE